MADKKYLPPTRLTSITAGSRQSNFDPLNLVKVTSNPLAEKAKETITVLKSQKSLIDDPVDQKQNDQAQAWMNNLDNWKNRRRTTQPRSSFETAESISIDEMVQEKNSTSSLSHKTLIDLGTDSDVIHTSKPHTDVPEPTSSFSSKKLSSLNVQSNASVEPKKNETESELPLEVKTSVPPEPRSVPPEPRSDKTASGRSEVDIPVREKPASRYRSMYDKTSMEDVSAPPVKTAKSSLLETSDDGGSLSGVKFTSRRSEVSRLPGSDNPFKSPSSFEASSVEPPKRSKFSAAPRPKSYMFPGGSYESAKEMPSRASPTLNTSSTNNKPVRNFTDNEVKAADNDAGAATTSQAGDDTEVLRRNKPASEEKHAKASINNFNKIKSFFETASNAPPPAEELKSFKPAEPRLRRTLADPTSQPSRSALDAKKRISLAPGVLENVYRGKVAVANDKEFIIDEIYIDPSQVKTDKSAVSFTRGRLTSDRSADSQLTAKTNAGRPVSARAYPKFESYKPLDEGSRHEEVVRKRTNFETGTKEVKLEETPKKTVDLSFEVFQNIITSPEIHSERRLETVKAETSSSEKPGDRATNCSTTKVKLVSSPPVIEESRKIQVVSLDRSDSKIKFSGTESPKVSTDAERETHGKRLAMHLDGLEKTTERKEEPVKKNSASVGERKRQMDAEEKNPKTVVLASSKESHGQILVKTEEKPKKSDSLHEAADPRLKTSAELKLEPESALNLHETKSKSLYDMIKENETRTAKTHHRVGDVAGEQLLISFDNDGGVQVPRINTKTCPPVENSTNPKVDAILEIPVRESFNVTVQEKQVHVPVDVKDYIDSGDLQAKHKTNGSASSVNGLQRTEENNKHSSSHGKQGLLIEELSQLHPPHSSTSQVSNSKHYSAITGSVVTDGPAPVKREAEQQPRGLEKETVNLSRNAKAQSSTEKIASLFAEIETTIESASLTKASPPAPAAVPRVPPKPQKSKPTASPGRVSVMLPEFQIALAGRPQSLARSKPAELTIDWDSSPQSNLLDVSASRAKSELLKKVKRRPPSSYASSKDNSFSSFDPLNVTPSDDSVLTDSFSEANDSRQPPRERVDDGADQKMKMSDEGFDDDDVDAQPPALPSCPPPAVSSPTPMSPLGQSPSSFVFLTAQSPAATARVPPKGDEYDDDEEEEEDSDDVPESSV